MVVIPTIPANKFNAEEFVDFLLDEGVKIQCDKSVESFYRTDLPPYYNEKLYKRGQKFFHNNIFALFFAKLLGLLSGLAIPSMVKILIQTKMSSTPLTAYKRYLSTLAHMCIWYESDFTPGSRLWQSINYVKNRHNSASRSCYNIADHHGINQKDMALTQFGFMGFALSQQEAVGLHNIQYEDWQAFTHIWRVIGFLIGIEDRFNICRESVEETKQICEVLINRVYLPEIEQKHEEFLIMSKNLMDGMWVMNPVLDTKVFLVYFYHILQRNNQKKAYYFDLNLREKCLFYFIMVVIWSLQFRIFRTFYNAMQNLGLWLMKIFPFLAYYKYGFGNSHVSIHMNYVREK